MTPEGPWPRVMVVTDRRRLTRHLDAADEAWPELLLAQIAGALAGGADLVQVRERDLDAGPLTRFLRRLFEAVRGSADRVVVNDRVDVAWVTGSAGVHLGERSLGVAETRAVLPVGRPWVIGRSVHDASTARQVQDAGYLVAGTVRASRSKPAGGHLLGWDGLAAITRATPVPVVAIGGLGPDDVAQVTGAGAVGLAGIECFLPALGEPVETSVQARVRAVREAFDSRGSEPYDREAGA